jgi:hypothetical protein
MGMTCGDWHTVIGPDLFEGECRVRRELLLISPRRLQVSCLVGIKARAKVKNRPVANATTNIDMAETAHSQESAIRWRSKQAWPKPLSSEYPRFLTLLSEGQSTYGIR